MGKKKVGEKTLIAAADHSTALGGGYAYLLAFSRKRKSLDSDAIPQKQPKSVRTA